MGKVQGKVSESIREGEWKKKTLVQRRNKKNSCKVSSSVGVRKCTYSKDTWQPLYIAVFLSRSWIPDSIDFLYKLLGKRKHFPFPDWYILAQQPHCYGYKTMCYINSDLALFMFWINDNCGHTCAHTCRTKPYVSRFFLRLPQRSKLDKHCNSKTIKWWVWYGQFQSVFGSISKVMSSVEGRSIC